MLTSKSVPKQTLTFSKEASTFIFDAMLGSITAPRTSHFKAPLRSVVHIDSHSLLSWFLQPPTINSKQQVSRNVIIMSLFNIFLTSFFHLSRFFTSSIKSLIFNFRCSLTDTHARNLVINWMESQWKYLIKIKICCVYFDTTATALKTGL